MAKLANHRCLIADAMKRMYGQLPSYVNIAPQQFTTQLSYTNTQQHNYEYTLKRSSGMRHAFSMLLYAFETVVTH